MIALFDEPPRVSIKLAGFGRVGMLLGMCESVGILEGIVCLEDGNIARIGADYLVIDWRYQVETDRWVDVNNREPDQEG